MQTGYIGESNSGYDGIIDMICIFTPSVSSMVVYRTKFCQFPSCTWKKNDLVFIFYPPPKCLYVLWWRKTTSLWKFYSWMVEL